MISVAEALERLFALIRPAGTETVPLTRACGRVLAADAVARRTQPPFAASAMDGYAVRAAEARQGTTLAVVGEAAAGRRHPGALPPGAAIRIFTGAPVPQGADAILIQEDARPDGDRIVVAEAPGPGAHIRPAGGDFSQGDPLRAPRRLTPRDVALLAAMNIPEITVSRRPRVALIATGDELVEPGEAPGPDQIVTSNNYGLAAMLAAIGAEPLLCGIARDSRASLLAALERAHGADFIVTLGGASVGDHDLVARVFGKAGLTLDFYKIAMRPGKPLMAGRMDGAVMLGLPGNPVSAMVCGEIFLRPAIDASLGLPARKRQTLTGCLTHRLAKNGPREHYMRAVIGEEGGEEGGEGGGEPGKVTVFDNQDSSLLATLARANGLVVRAPHAAKSAAGARIRYIPL
jgi:molybdopterin molybdotransferase